MTIIVASAKLGKMAADTLIVYGYDKAGHSVKIVRGADGSIGGACGEAPYCSEFLAWVAAGRKGKPSRKWFKHMNGLVLTADRQLLTYEGPVPDKLIGDYHAIGCGAPFALAAMGLSHNIELAADVACEHSVACGGDVTVLELKGKRKPRKK